MNYGQSICQNISNNIWYKPTVEIVRGDTVVAIKVPAFIVFTKEFIKGEGAKQREVVYQQQQKKDSIYIGSLTRTNEFAASEIINQTTQKDSIKTQAIIQIADTNKKADRKVKNTKLFMVGSWLIAIPAAFFIGTKF